MPTNKPELPSFASDAEAEDFVDHDDLSRYDLSGAKPYRFSFGGGHRFEIVKDKKGEYRVRFKHNGEIIFATEGYSSSASAKRAIEAIKRYAPGAEVGEIQQTSAQKATG